MQKLSQSDRARQDYSKSKVGTFFETQCRLIGFDRIAGSVKAPQKGRAATQRTLMCIRNFFFVFFFVFFSTYERWTDVCLQ